MVEPLPCPQCDRPFGDKWGPSLYSSGWYRRLTCRNCYDGAPDAKCMDAVYGDTEKATIEAWNEAVLNWRDEHDD